MSVVDPKIHNLSICSGVAMLDEGFSLATGARTVGYVEREASATAILLARMADAALEPALVWCGDLHAFDGKRWRGAVDSITAGFPCQPWSAAGKKSGIEDERWIWPAIARIIGEVGSQIVFLENVPGLVSHDGLGHVLSSLAELGFDAEWGSIRASDVGAAHQRERVFILAYRAEFGRTWALLSAGSGRQEWNATPYAGGSEPALADSGSGFIPQPERGPDRRNGAGQAGAELAESAQRGCRELREPSEERERFPDGSDASLFAPGPGSSEWRDILSRAPWLPPAVEPGVRMLADGLAVVVDESRADQLRAIGNGVVALQAAAAFRILARRILDSRRADIPTK